MPCSWGDFPLDPTLFDQHYLQSPCRTSRFEVLPNEADINAAFHVWSKGVEDAVKKTLAQQHRQHPLHYPQAVLSKKLFGRCAPTRYVSHTAPKTPKHGPTNGYNPPVEATTCKARLKTRQVRRVTSLINQLKAYQRQPQPHRPVQQLQHEWDAIIRAQGYGNTWTAWLLSFDFIPYIPIDLPDLEWLALALQVTRFDADAFARRANFA